MKKWILICVIILIAVLLFLFSQSKLNSQKGTVFGKVELRTLTEIVTETGSISTNGSIAIYSTTDGLVQKIFVENGQYVKEGQKLFSVKSTANQIEKSQAYSSYLAAKASLKQAENNRRGSITTVDRVHDDVRNHDKDETFTQKETRTLAEVANDNALESINIAKANLISAEANYFSTQNSTVLAPISGRITNLSVSSGSAVISNSPANPQPPVIMIGNIGATELLVTVGENEINKIYLGQLAQIKFDALENETFQGIVSRFDEVGKVVQGVPKYNVYIEVTNPDKRLKPGMNADVDIQTTTANNVLTVPTTSIKPYQNGKAVRVYKNNQIEFVPVKIGIKSKEYTQIISGLSENQSIVVSLPSEATSKSSLLKF